MSKLFTLLFLLNVLVCGTSMVHVDDEYHAWSKPTYPPIDDTECILGVNNKSARYFGHMLEIHHPNLVYFSLQFDIQLNSTKESILPNQWIWTYSSPDLYFPYLKLPVDFSALSLGLLDVKTLPVRNEKLFVNISTKGDCTSLKLGQPETTRKIGYALRDMTTEYLLHIDRLSYSFSYWCHLEEVPNVKDSFTYTLGMVIGFPINFEGYKCCESGVSSNKVFLHCYDKFKYKMYQVTIIPYIIGLVAFLYFPVFISGHSERFLSTGKYTHLQPEKVPENNQDLVFLNGNSPLGFTYLLCGLCGLANSHPLLVSRLRRAVFVVFSPLLLFVELYIYYIFQFDTFKDLLDHGKPISYLRLMYNPLQYKMIDTAFGGPLISLILYYISSFVFIAFPSDMNSVIHYGSKGGSNRSKLSPLFFDDVTIENLSGINITRRHGYGKANAILMSNFFMLMNPYFWKRFFQIQLSRISKCREHLYAICQSDVFSTIVLILLLPLGLLIFLIELLVTFLYFGIPVICAIVITSRGLVYNMTNTISRQQDPNNTHLSNKVRERMVVPPLRYIMAVIITCWFIYYIFSLCIIFTLSFSFVAQLLVFSLLAVIVYPSLCFGYLFFVLALLYYIYTLIKSFGDGYTELLSDAVEISSQMNEGMVSSRIFNETLVVSAQNGFNIKQINVRGQIIDLSSDQRQKINAAYPLDTDKVKETSDGTGIPRDLFDTLVRKHRPVHIQVTRCLLWLGLVIFLIGISISIIVVNPVISTEGLSEVMHVIFIMVVGALPKVLGIMVSGHHHAIAREIERQKIKASIQEYWDSKTIQINADECTTMPNVETV